MSKVLIVTDNFPPDVPGGISLVTYHLAACLPYTRVEVVAPAGPHSEPFDNAQSFRVTRLPFSTRNRMATVLSSVRFSLRAVRLARKENCALLYLAKPWPLGLAGLLARLAGLPYVVHTHGSDIFRRRGKVRDALCSMIMRRSSCVIANSEFTRALALRMGAHLHQTVVMYPKVDPKRFQEPFDAVAFADKEGLSGKRILLTVGRLANPRKGIDRVLEALPAILAEFPDTVYVVIGEGRDRPRLEAMALDLGVKSHVRFVGNRDTAAYFRLADIFVMVSRVVESDGDVESFGIVYLEANACGVPVVAGRSGGVAEAVEDGVSGLLVDPDCPDMIAEAIVRLLSDDELRRQLGRHGQVRVMERFTTERYGPEFERVIERVLCTASQDFEAKNE